MPVVTLDDLKSKKSAKPTNSKKRSAKQMKKGGFANAPKAGTIIHTLADLNKRTNRSITSTKSVDDVDDNRDFAPLSEDEDSDVMSVDEAEMAAEMQGLIDQDDSLIHVLNVETMDDGQLLDDIRSSDVYKKLTVFKMERTNGALDEVEKEALEAEHDPGDQEANRAILPVMVTDVNNRAAGTFKYDPSHVDSNGLTEWEVVKTKIKLKSEIIVDGEKRTVEEIKMAAKLFKDGSIAVRKRRGRGKGKSEKKNQRKRMRK